MDEDIDISFYDPLNNSSVKVNIAHLHKKNVTWEIVQDLAMAKGHFIAMFNSEDTYHDYAAYLCWLTLITKNFDKVIRDNGSVFLSRRINKFDGLGVLEDRFELVAEK